MAQWTNLQWIKRLVNQLNATVHKTTPTGILVSVLLPSSKYYQFCSHYACAHSHCVC